MLDARKNWITSANGADLFVWSSQGTAGEGASTPLFSVETLAPTVAVSIDNADLTPANNQGKVTFSFSVAPSDFSLDDVVATGGALGPERAPPRRQLPTHRPDRRWKRRATEAKIDSKASMEAPAACNRSENRW